VPPLYNLNHLPAAGFTLLTSEYAVRPTGISPGRCPRCGGELQFKANVGSLGKDAETYFFQCKDCDHIHTVDENRLNADWH
jgi:hypothetical protein